MPTPSRLRTLRATRQSPEDETFVFCTTCHKITVKITVEHNIINPVDITFKAEQKPDSDKLRECCCDESGWVQFVEEAVWELDNSSTPRWKKVIGDEIPERTPSRVSAPEEGNPDRTEARSIWYGETPDTPQDEIHDTPGTGTTVIQGGDNDGARRKRFVTRNVCRNRNEDGTRQDGTHEFELRWDIYHHAQNGWTKITLRGSTPASLATETDNCP